MTSWPGWSLARNRAAATVACHHRDRGCWGYQMPLDADGKAITPGSLDAVARGCLCDPGRNNDGQGHDNDGGRIFIFNDRCKVHRRLKLN